MADFVLTTIGGSITGTSGNDNMTFGIEVVDGVPFIATGTLSGSGGDDNFFTLNPSALINGIQLANGNEGRDTIQLSNLFTAYGGKDNDRIQAIPILGTPDVAGQQMYGGDGDDTIDAGGGNDYVEGNEGNDTILAGAGFDLVYGGKGNDTIDGGEQADTIYGNIGNDSIIGGLGLDSINGGQDNDIIFGDLNLDAAPPAGEVRVSDTIFGNQGNDSITGGRDAGDSMHGGQGNDTIVGGIAGLANGQVDDTIIGGAGNDSLTGGIGNIGITAVTTNAQYDDLFRYQDGAAANAGNLNVDVITDFESFGGPLLAMQRPDKISLAVGDGAVLAGLNFTTSTTYRLNNVGAANNPLPVVTPGAPVPVPALPPGIVGNTAIGLTAPVAGFTSYAEVFTAINNYFAVNTITPIASSSTELQVYNFYSRGGVTAGLGGGLNGFLYINDGDTTVDSGDMLIQGVNVNNYTATGVTDIVFG